MPTLSTKFTRALNLRYPIASAPMAFAGGGALAAAVTRTGGLGLMAIRGRRRNEFDGHHWSPKHGTGNPSCTLSIAGSENMTDRIADGQEHFVSDSIHLEKDG